MGKIYYIAKITHLSSKNTWKIYLMKIYATSVLSALRYIWCIFCMLGWNTFKWVDKGIWYFKNRIVSPKIEGNVDIEQRMGKGTILLPVVFITRPLRKNHNNSTQ